MPAPQVLLNTVRAEQTGESEEEPQPGSDPVALKSVPEHSGSDTDSRNFCLFGSAMTGPAPVLKLGEGSRTV